MTGGPTDASTAPDSNSLALPLVTQAKTVCSSCALTELAESASCPVCAALLRQQAAHVRSGDHERLTLCMRELSEHKTGWSHRGRA